MSLSQNDARIAYLNQFYSVDQIEKYCAGSEDTLNELYLELQPKEVGIESIRDVNDGVQYFCDSPDGFVPVEQWRNKGIKKTFRISLDNGLSAIASDDHLFQKANMEWAFSRDLIVGDVLMTKTGQAKIIAHGYCGENTVYDLAIGHENHRYYTNDICSHNSGKSLFLQNVAINWAIAGFTVVYISLELSEELIGLRLDAMITGRGTSEVLRDVDETVMIIRNTERVHKPGKLFIKKMPEGGTTVNTLRAYMKELQIKTGLKPDALVIDYLDLMYSTNPRIDPSDQFIKDKYVSEEIRGLMHETNTIGATASQLNRSSFDAERYDHSHIAGGISKINTADNVFGIVSSFSMKEKGIYKLQFLKTRSSSAVGQEIELGYDSKSMRITDPVMVEDMDKMFSKDDLQKMMKADPKSSSKNNNTTTNDDSGSKLDRMRKRAGL